MFKKNIDIKKIYNSTITRLFVIFLFIIIPVYITGISIYTNGMRITKNEIFNSMQGRINFILDSLGNEVTQSESIITNYVYTKKPLRLAFMYDIMDNYDRLELVNSIYDDLSIIKGRLDYAEDVGIYMPTINRVISTRESFSEFDKASYDKLMSGILLSNYPSNIINDEIYILSRYPYANPSHKTTRTFLCYIELSHEKIKNGIEESLNNENIIFELKFMDSDFTISNTDFEIVLDDNKNTAGKNHDYWTIKLDKSDYIAIHNKSEELGLELILAIPESMVFMDIIISRNSFILFTILALLATLLYSIYIHRFIKDPIRILTEAFKKLEDGNTNITIKKNSENEFGLLYKQFNHTVGKLHELINKNYRQEVLMKNAELSHLQSQINPHFLYNSFFLLNSMTEMQDYDNLKEYTNQLGQYFKYITRNYTNDVNLSEEVEHALLYSNMQERRFMNRIKVNFSELPSELNNIEVPRLFLQPLIENVYQHGLKNKISDGKLHVGFLIKDKMCVVNVEDNGDEINDNRIAEIRKIISGKSNQHTGLANISQRFIYKYGLEYGLEISISSLGGLCVKVHIPIEA